VTAGYNGLSNKSQSPVLLDFGLRAAMARQKSALATSKVSIYVLLNSSFQLADNQAY